MRFSQRIGKRPIKTVLQVESIDDDLQNRLWNVVLEEFFNKLNNSSSYGGDTTEKQRVCNYIWKEFFGKPIDEIPHYYNSEQVAPEAFVEYIREWFYKAEWFDLYDLIEFLADINAAVKKLNFVANCNLALKREVAGYRIVDDKVVQITSEEEIQEIEEATVATEKWKSVNSHLRTALNMLADRKSPDYRNSIKESISAVEALCIIITDDPSATLGKALIEIEKKHSIHKALKTAFSAIYGYTSDSGGIRHALLETDTEIEFEEAKFMLVSCSAFVNYLKSKVKI